MTTLIVTDDEGGRRIVDANDVSLMMSEMNRLRRSLLAAKTVIKSKDNAYSLMEQRWNSMAAKAATVDSERECNERLTGEIDALRARVAELEAKGAQAVLDVEGVIEKIVEYGWHRENEGGSYATFQKFEARKCRAEADDVIAEIRAMLASRTSAPVAPATVAVPDEVMRALDRMCTPLDDSWLGSASATAQADSRSMNVIRDYILGSAVKDSLTTEPFAWAYRFSLPKRHDDMRDNDEFSDVVFRARRELSPDDAYGRRGRDFSDDADITEIPLYTRPSAPVGFCACVAYVFK